MNIAYKYAYEVDTFNNKNCKLGCSVRKQAVEVMLSLVYTICLALVKLISMVTTFRVLFCYET